MEEQPGWYNGQFWMKSALLVILFAVTPMVWCGRQSFPRRGRIHDENGIKKQIYGNAPSLSEIGAGKKNATTVLKCSAWKPTRTTYPSMRTGLHVANGTLFVNGEFTEHKEFCRKPSARQV